MGRICHGAAMKETPPASRVLWRRTWPDVRHDFTAMQDGRAVARIYRHTDGRRWQWFDLTDGAQGIEEEREAALRAIAGRFALRD